MARMRRNVPKRRGSPGTYRLGKRMEEQELREKRREIMQEFIYYAPTEVVFGKDAEKKNSRGSKKMGREQATPFVWRRQCEKKRAA